MQRRNRRFYQLGNFLSGESSRHAPVVTDVAQGRNTTLGGGAVNGYRLHELVDEGDFYLAYLDGDPSWEFYVPPNAKVSPDVAFFDRLRDELTRSLPVDPDRVYAVGMSKGGDFAVYLAERRSTRIAAVVSQAACVPEAVEAERPFPLMIIVGTAEGGIPPDRLLSVPQAFRDRGHIVEVLRPENIGHCWHVPSNRRLWEFLSRHRLKDRVITVSER